MDERYDERGSQTRIRVSLGQQLKTIKNNNGGLLPE